MATDLNELRRHVEVLKLIKMEKARLSDLEGAARAAIEDALGGDEVGEIDGREVVRWRHVKSSRVDTKLLKSLYPDVAAECTTAVESRRFEVTA